MVFNRELEVRQCDGDERGDDEEHTHGEEEDAVKGIQLMAPNRGEYVVQLDVDRGEWKEARHEDLAWP